MHKLLLHCKESTEEATYGIDSLPPREISLRTPCTVPHGRRGLRLSLNKLPKALGGFLLDLLAYSQGMGGNKAYVSQCVDALQLRPGSWPLRRGSGA
jgi:hypothetical protein